MPPIWKDGVFSFAKIYGELGYLWTGLFAGLACVDIPTSAVCDSIMHISCLRCVGICLFSEIMPCPTPSSKSNELRLESVGLRVLAVQLFQKPVWRLLARGHDSQVTCSTHVELGRSLPYYMSYSF